MQTYFKLFIAVLISGFFFSESSSAQSFQKHKVAVSKDYTYNGTWRVEKNPRKVADVNGDGRADIVGFANRGVYVSLAKSDGTFGTRKNVYDNFSYDIGSWRVEKHPRELADVNGDGKADIVGFGNSAVYVALGKSDGTFAKHFAAYTKSFTYDKGSWRVDKNPRTVADVNGDGRADIVGFGNSAVYVALGKSDGTFAKHFTAHTETFSYNKGSWRVEKNPRTVADVNGDGRADIVGFGNSAVYVALGKSDGTFGKYFKAYSESFTYNKGTWRVEKNPRTVADINGDGRADIVGFGNSAVYVALGKSDGTFAKHTTAYTESYTYNKGSWRVNKNPREVADVNGDGKADIVGFGNSAVYVSLASGSKPTLGRSNPRPAITVLDSVRGWNSYSTHAVFNSMVVFNGKKTVLHIDNPNKDGFNIQRTLNFSSSDNIRGWSWDGKTASYLVVKDGKTFLYIRPFNGTTFGKHRSLSFSSKDFMLAWCLRGKTAYYFRMKSGKVEGFRASFDGQTFSNRKPYNPFKDKEFAGLKLRGFSKGGYDAYTGYHYKNGSSHYINFQGTPR